MRWLLDTSVWARRHQPGVAREIERLYDEGAEFVLSASALLEILRAPQGAAVRTERERILSAVEILSENSQTVGFATDAMVDLAAGAPTGHRRSVTELLTAALAHQHGVGVLHADADYTLISEGSGLDFAQRRCVVDDAESPDSPGASQRQLKKEMSQLLHQLPVEESEALLRQFVDELKSAVGAGAR